MDKAYRIPFSRIRAAWLRRSLMLLAYPLMVAGNLLFILWAGFKALLALPLVLLLKAVAAPFQLLNEGFIEAWHGCCPGSDRAATKKAEE